MGEKREDTNDETSKIAGSGKLIRKHLRYCILKAIKVRIDIFRTVETLKKRTSCALKYSIIFMGH